MAGKEYSEIVTVNGDEDGIIQFKVGIKWYHDPGRCYGPADYCYPPEWEKIDEEILDVLVADIEIEDDELRDAILNKYDIDWIYDQAWSEV